MHTTITLSKIKMWKDQKPAKDGKETGQTCMGQKKKKEIKAKCLPKRLTKILYWDTTYS